LGAYSVAGLAASPEIKVGRYASPALHRLALDGRNASGGASEGAARLAAYYSEGRTDTRVDVDVTEVRNVRKIPGGAPGRVTYQHFRTLRVEPGIDSWTAEKGG